MAKKGSVLVVDDEEIMREVLAREDEIDRDREHFWVIGLASNHRLLQESRKSKIEMLTLSRSNCVKFSKINVKHLLTGFLKTMVLTKEDVMALCQPIKDEVMDAYTISKLITTKGEDTNVEKVLEKEFYPELNSL